MVIKAIPSFQVSYWGSFVGQLFWTPHIFPVEIVWIKVMPLVKAFNLWCVHTSVVKSLSPLVSAGELVQGSNLECGEHISLCPASFHFGNSAEWKTFPALGSGCSSVVAGWREALAQAAEGTRCRMAGESPVTGAWAGQTLELGAGEFEEFESMEGRIRLNNCLCW